MRPATLTLNAWLDGADEPLVVRIRSVDVAALEEARDCSWYGRQLRQGDLRFLARHAAERCGLLTGDQATGWDDLCDWVELAEDTEGKAPARATRSGQTGASDS